MVYVYPRYAPMAEFIQKSGVWFVRGLQEDTHQERDLLPRDGAVGSPSASRVGSIGQQRATAALLIWLGTRHLVEKIYLFGGLY